MGAKTTVGVNFSRKILECILGGAAVYSPGSDSGGVLSPSTIWDSSVAATDIDDTPTGPPSGWHKMDDAPLNDITIWATTAAEQQRFRDEYDSNFERNVCVQTVDDTALPGSQTALGPVYQRTLLITATVRWRDKGGGWKYVRNQALFTNK